MLQGSFCSKSMIYNILGVTWQSTYSIVLYMNVLVWPTNSNNMHIKAVQKVTIRNLLLTNSYLCQLPKNGVDNIIAASFQLGQTMLKLVLNF